MFGDSPSDYCKHEDVKRVGNTLECKCGSYVKLNDLIIKYIEKVEKSNQVSEEKIIFIQ